MQCPNEPHGDKRKERYFIHRKDRHRRVGGNMFDYKDPKCKGEFCSRPTAVTVSSDPPTSDPSTSDPPTSDPPTSDPTSNTPSSDPPSSEPVSDPLTVEHVLLPESQETFPSLCNDSTIFDVTPIY